MTEDIYKWRQDSQHTSSPGACPVALSWSVSTGHRVQCNAVTSASVSLLLPLLVVLALHNLVSHQESVLWPACSISHQQAPPRAGDWEAGAARDAQDPGLAVEESEDDAAGDFEDIETGTRSVACVHHA